MSLVRAQLLFQQSRYDLAAKELRQTLVEDPQDARAHAWLALCLTKLKEFDEAEREANEATGLEPDNPFMHYARAHILFDRQRTREAGGAITQAIRIDPENPDYHALLANIYVADRRWKDAVAAAEQGLSLDPEHVVCTNLRALALVHLGERELAGQSIEAALRKDPENAVTHANQGWALLHQGKNEQALEHFREALRLNPNLEWARSGIVEALKAKHMVYRIMLRYFLFMSRLSRRAQWALVIGGFIGARLLQMLANQNPALSPYVMPLIYCYAAFVILTWISPHLFNWLLRLNRFGRLVLSRDQRIASNWITLWMFGTAVALFVATRMRDPAVLDLAIMIGLLVLPLSGTFVCPKGWPRWVMVGVTAALTMLAIICFYIRHGQSLTGTQLHWAEELMNVFLIGVIGSQVLANALISVRVTR